MAQQLINIGPANGGLGDFPATYCAKINANFTEVYALLNTATASVNNKQPLNANLTALSSGTITGVGTAANTLAAGNDSRIVGAVQQSGLSSALDTAFSSTRGSVLYRGASGWSALAPSTAGYVLQTGGTGADPTWSPPSSAVSSAALDTAFGSTQGSILYRGASAWTALTPGTAGYVLQTGGAGANPSWAAPSGSLGQPQGRLTLTSATPVLTSTVSAATSVLYTPYVGNLVPIWNGSAFTMTAFTETTQALSDATKSPNAAAANNVYDLFAWSDSGTIRVTRGPAWSAGTGGSSTVRGTGAGGTALTRVTGVLVNAAAITNGPAAGYGTYVGTIATDAGGATVTFNTGTIAASGGAATVGLWNAYNRVPVAGSVRDSTDSWTYATAAWRAANGSATARVTFVSGLAEDAWEAAYNNAVAVSATTGDGLIGIGFNSTTAFTGTTGFANTAQKSGLRADANTTALGQNYFSAIEYVLGGVTATYIGDIGTPAAYQTGLNWRGRY